MTTDTRGCDIGAAMLILASTGYVDLAAMLLRRWPAAGQWWREHGVDIERELESVSRHLGRREWGRAMGEQLRGVVPLLKSRLGRLRFRQPEREY